MARSGASVAIEALAGTGKTTTLALVADALPDRGLYVAFNRAIVEAATQKFPTSVTCKTAHGLAFGAIGHRYKNRLDDSRRLQPRDIAEILGCAERSLRLPEGRNLDGARLAVLAQRTANAFAKSSDFELAGHHVPRPPGIDKRSHALLSEKILPLARKAWDDLSHTAGRLKFSHDVYLKLWHLDGPRIDKDYIMFDEAQDADPVMLAIIQAQTEAQRIYVGDRFQAIYEWRGAINAMEHVKVEKRAWLTQSFRFGDPIADRANHFLMKLGTDQRLRGNPNKSSSVGRVERPAAILTRTNAYAMFHVIEELDRGGYPALVGGGEDIKRFAKAAEMLQAGKPTSHSELACFNRWEEVRSFVESEGCQEADELGMLVRLVDKFGARVLGNYIKRCAPEESQSSVIVSTAHKAKGREWLTVQIAEDFSAANTESENKSPTLPEELRLAYVAVTRAIEVLDLTNLQKGNNFLRANPRPSASTGGLREQADSAIDRRQVRPGTLPTQQEVQVRGRQHILRQPTNPTEHQRTSKPTHIAPGQQKKNPFITEIGLSEDLIRRRALAVIRSIPVASGIVSTRPNINEFPTQGQPRAGTRPLQHTPSSAALSFCRPCPHCGAFLSERNRINHIQRKCARRPVPSTATHRRPDETRLRPTAVVGRLDRSGHTETLSLQTANRATLIHEPPTKIQSTRIRPKCRQCGGSPILGDDVCYSCSN